MDVPLLQRVVELTDDSPRLGYLLGRQPLWFQHVVEIHVAAKVQLIRPVQPHSPILKQPRQNPMDDSSADLTLDIIPDHGQPPLLEATLPVLLPGDEHRHAVHQTTASVQDLLDVPLRGHLAPHGQEAHHDVRLRLLENAYDVGRGPWRFGDHLAQILAQPVVGHTPADRHVEPRDLGELGGVVGLLPDSLR